MGTKEVSKCTVTSEHMPGRNARGLQSKLLITPLSERSHNIIILQVWCSLKSVTVTLVLLFGFTALQYNYYTYAYLYCGYGHEGGKQMYRNF